jgi:hypothetical protein
MAAEIKKQMADPNTEAIKTVKRKTKNCPAVLCKPVIK